MPIKSSYNQSSPAGVAVPKLGQKIRSTYGTVSSPMQFLSDLGIFATVDPLCFNPLISILWFVKRMLIRNPLVSFDSIDPLYCSLLETRFLCSLSKGPTALAKFVTRRTTTVRKEVTAFAHTYGMAFTERFWCTRRQHYCLHRVSHFRNLNCRKNIPQN